jgi:TPR repeat protein
MKTVRRVASANYLIVLGTVVALYGCGESTTSPPGKLETTKIIAEQEFAAQTKKAEAGEADAQLALGWTYLGVPNATKAGEWFEKVAEQGHADAHSQLYLGATKAVMWFQKAAEQGHAKAQLDLGGMYANGYGVPKDGAKAAEWFQKAAVQGHAEAQYFLGQMYHFGNGVPKDGAKAVEWYEKAAAKGNASANSLLGQMYHSGNGVPKDAAKAAEWYQKAAAQGDASAQFTLGQMYVNGDGVPKNGSKAVEWFQKAAVQGYAAAQNKLARHYGAGEGIPRDIVLAYAWFNLAAIKADADSLTGRQWAESSLSVNELAEAQRLSSNWKKGQTIVREDKPTIANAGTSSPSGKLTKQSTGTIFVVNKTGLAITNQHVTGGCAELRIQGRDALAKLVTEDLVNDLSLVQIPGTVKDSGAIAAEPAKLRQGEDVVVYGFPLNAVLSSGGNLTPGVVSAMSGLGNNSNQIQVTAPIQPGSSGSPVLNRKGEVVGVMAMKLSDSKMAKATGQIGQNVNFAVNGQTLKTFLDTHKVEYRTGGIFSFDKSTADLADEARKWTLVVECWK